MKTWWNILIWMWTGLVHRAECVNGDFVLTSSPLIPTDGELFTLTCSFLDESIVNIGWLQNNKAKVVTQQSPDCRKQQLAYGQDIINRINVSCSTTAHSMTFTFNSTTDQGAAWQCGKQANDNDIHPRSNNYTIGSVMSTQSLSTTTGHVDTTTPETVTTKKDVASSAISTQSLSTATKSLTTTSSPETVTPRKDVASSVMSTQSLSTTTRSTDRTSPPETVTPKKDVATSVMSTRFLSTTTRSMDITSYFETVTPDVASSAMSTQSLSTATQSLATTSNPETTTPKKDVSSSAMSTQSPPTATQSLATTSNPETVTPAKDDSNSDTLYIVVGVVAGVVLLILVVVIGCILWRRKAAHQHYDLKEGINVKSTPFSQNTSSNTVENDLYERSPDVPPINAASNQEEDFILSDAYASDDMAMENTCTPQEQVSSGDVDLENMYAKPDKGQPSNVEHDVYTEVQKPKKNIQDPSVSGTDITGDVYATSNKGRNAHL